MTISATPALQSQEGRSGRRCSQAGIEDFTKAFRKRFQVPADAPSLADRICQQQPHDWIEAFLVSHREVR